MDKMREGFEEWAVSRGYSLKMIAQPAAEYCLKISIYANGQTRSAWQAWMASRAAVTVNLPTAFDAAKDDATYYEYAFLQSDIEKALDAAGISYK